MIVNVGRYQAVVRVDDVSHGSTLVRAFLSCEALARHPQSLEMTSDSSNPPPPPRISAPHPS